MASPAPPIADSKKPATPPPSKDGKGGQAVAATEARKPEAGNGRNRATAQNKPGAATANETQNAAKGAASTAADKTAATSQQRFDRMAVRAKLAVSEPGDAVEREADQVADRVMRMAEAPATGIGADKPIGSARPDKQNKQKLEDKPPLVRSGHTSPASTEGTHAATRGGEGKPEIAREATPEADKEKNKEYKAQADRLSVSADFAGQLGEGEPLDAQTRAFFEQRLEADLSGVRVHTDANADKATKQIQARAFTHGRHMAFANGQFQPGSEEGKRLLAHELTHVVQQGGGAARHIQSGDNPVGHDRSSAAKSIHAAAQPLISRSPLSDDLRTVLLTQGKGALFERLRNLQVSDPDVLTLVDSDLAGDDRWLARNLVLHGRESGWPIHLRVEREMKGWADCGGKGVAFEMLRTANGADAANADLTATIARIFGGDDLWLAQNLQQYGREANWPIHLRVEREMKGWADCGGKAVAFEMLRTANGADAANADLSATIARIFGGDDLWLAQNLQQYGREANWPIHLRVEREMKGWADCGGKTVAFEILRTANGADAANADLSATIARIFGGDDLWLAQNLQQYGREANWPIHLRVEREMKGWADCGGKGAVFNILRTDGGAHANDANLIASLTAVFAAGTDDAKLAVLLRKYGAEASWPAPVQEYQCPFDFAPQSSPSERILYNGRYSVVPGADAHYHELVFTAVNGTFDSAGGPVSKTFTTGTADNRIDTGNFSFFIPAAFAAGARASVTMQLKQKSTGSVVMTNTWNFTPRAVAPTTIHQVQTNAPVAIGSTYDYNLGPALPMPAVAPFYEHQTVLEEFAARTSNLQIADMSPAWITAENITTKAGLDARLFGGSSNNGTFVIDAGDQIHDQHGGGTGMLDTAATHLAAPMQIDVDLPQTYTAGPGNVLGNYTVRRSRKAVGGYELRKFGP